MWSTPQNTYALLGVVAHFVLEHKVDSFERRIQTVMLALRRVEDKHDGDNIGQVLLEVIYDFDIANNVGIFICDNPAVNDCAIDYVLKQIEPDIANRTARRSRCVAHIINLAAKAFLFGSSTEAIQDEIASTDSARLKTAQEEWRKRGAFGKLHNLVAYVRGSVQRSEAFAKIITGNPAVDDLKLLQNNATRWNSHYTSISRALLLRERIELYCFKHRDDVEKDTLSAEEWAHLQEIHGCLQLFNDTTTTLESNARDAHSGSIWEWLPTIELLINAMIKYIEENKKTKPVPPLLVAHQQAFKKLKKYYELSDKAYTIYAAATLLSPECRYAYFSDSWNTPTTKRHLPIMLKAVRNFYDKNYAGQVEVEQRPAERPTPIDIHLGRVTATLSTASAFDTYVYGVRTPLAAPIELNILSWWSKIGPSQLRRFAYDLLSIPATSCAAERIFSGAGDLLSNPRTNRMIDTTIEARELLRNWWMSGLIA